MTHDRKFDLVVVGFGLSGATAAAIATAAGARTLVLDAAPKELAGGNSLVSGNGFIATSSPSAMREYVHSLGTSMRAATTIAEGAEAVVSVLAALGVQLRQVRKLGADFAELPGAHAVERWRLADETGPSAVRLVQQRAIQSGALVRFGSRSLGAEHLEGGGVRIFHRSGGAVSWSDARYGVVLACGGWGARTRRYRSNHGSPFSQGDGLRVAADLGARPAPGPHYSGPFYGFSIPSSRQALTPTALYSVTDPHPVLRHRLISRRTLEPLVPADPRLHGLARSRQGLLYVPDFEDAILLFTEEDLSSGPLVGSWPDGHARTWGRLTHTPWSLSNEVEIRQGWVRHVGGSIRQTVGAALRSDLFGMAVSPTVLNTLGGLRTDESYRVLGRSGPVPGLFSAGELASVFRMRYQGSANLTECVISASRAVGSALSGAKASGKDSPRPWTR